MTEPELLSHQRHALRAFRQAEGLRTQQEDRAESRQRGYRPATEDGVSAARKRAVELL